MHEGIPGVDGSLAVIGALGLADADGYVDDGPPMLGECVGDGPAGVGGYLGDGLAEVGGTDDICEGHAEAVGGDPGVSLAPADGALAVGGTPVYCPGE
jgi:hypothetical protein